MPTVPPPSRPARRAAAVLGCAVLLTAGCGTGSTAADPCATAAVTITAPRDGAALSPGPLTVTGRTAIAGCAVDWTLQDGTGAVTATGRVAGTADGIDGGGVLAVPVTVAPGGYRFTLEPAGSAVGAAARRGPGSTVAGQVGPAGTLTWTSGASGAGTADGDLARWRGSAVPMSGTWADEDDAQVELWTLQPGAEYGAWTGDMDIAIGAIDEGETWAAAATGAYDARWTRSVQALAARWAGRPGTLHIRFAHEFNGASYPWRVTSATAADFVAAWHRFRAIQQQWFPSARLVFSPNDETSSEVGFDWRTAYPGPGQVDVMSVSYFNRWPWTDSAESFRAKALSVDASGAPRGIQRHLEFAGSVGLPFAVSEWGNEAWAGDSAEFMRQMFGFFNANAGTGPGRLAYEVLFNVVHEPNDFAVFPDTHQPRAAQAYRDLW